MVNPGVETGPTAVDRVEPWRTQLAIAAVMFAASLAIMGIFDSIAGGTYDFDEFVYVLLGQGLAGGRLPYRDFLFFHPPGILTLMALLEPLVRVWWAWGRSISLVLSATTCSLVYVAARRFCTRPVAIVAAILCACDPIMLVTGTRILPDVYVMFFTFLGVVLLLPGSRDAARGQWESGWRWFKTNPLGILKPLAFWDRTGDPVTSKEWLLAALAGASFGVGIWFKYPTVLAIPAALSLTGRRRWPVFLGVMALTAVVLFAPFLTSFHSLYQDTVVYQQSRFSYPFTVRLLSIILFGIVLQPLAIFGLSSRPVRWWLVLGYGSALFYLATSQVYYHYLLPMVPFASILGAIYLGRLTWVTSRRLVAGAAALALGLTVLWAVVTVDTPGDYPFHITAAHVASVTPVSRYIDKRVHSNGEIWMTSRTYPYLRTEGIATTTSGATTRSSPTASCNFASCR